MHMLSRTEPENTIKHTSLQIIRDEHSSLAAMLHSMRMMVERGPRDNPEQFFDVLRAMLFYIDEFPERMHHPKETQLLFPRVKQAAPSVAQALEQLEHDHTKGEAEVRDLLIQLVAWEVLGEARMPLFVEQCKRYVNFYLDHMRLEETVIFPAAEQFLTDADWKELDAAFGNNRDPLSGKYPPDPAYARLFTRITMHTPAPIGLGNE